MLGLFYYYPWGTSTVVLVLSVLFLIFLWKIGLKRIILCLLVVGLVVLAVKFNLIFWIPLIFLCLIVWGFLVAMLKGGYKKLTGRDFSCKMPVLDSYVKSDDVIECCKNGIRLTENGKRLLKDFDTEKFFSDYACAIFYEIRNCSNKNEEYVYVNIFCALLNKYPEVNNYVTKTKRFVIIDKDGKHCEKKMSKTAMYKALTVALTEAYLDLHPEIPRKNKPSWNESY